MPLSMKCEVCQAHVMLDEGYVITLHAEPGQNVTVKSGREGVQREMTICAPCAGQRVAENPEGVVAALRLQIRQGVLR